MPFIIHAAAAYEHIPVVKSVKEVPQDTSAATDSGKNSSWWDSLAEAADKGAQAVKSTVSKAGDAIKQGYDAVKSSVSAPAQTQSSEPAVKIPSAPYVVDAKVMIEKLRDADPFAPKFFNYNVRDSFNNIDVSDFKKVRDELRWQSDERVAPYVDR